MIWLHYGDERERLATLQAVVQHCQQSESRLAFVGVGAACDLTRAGLRMRSVGVDLVEWVRLPTTDELEASSSGASGAGLLRAALASLPDDARPLLVWVESPQRWAGWPVLEDASAIVGGREISALCAFALGDVDSADMRRILAVAKSVVAANTLVPRFPEWVVIAARIERGLDAGLLDAAGLSYGLSTTVCRGCRLERLATLGQLAAGVAHELGNPLAIISSSLQYLHRRLELTGDEATEFTRTALLNVERMHTLVRGMVDFARARRPRLEKIDIREPISETLRFTAAECARSGVVVDVAFDPSLPALRADPSGIKQILLNLIRNALDAMGQLGGTLSVRTRLHASGESAVIEVADDGPPIPIDVMRTLFRPFVTSKVGGTGLGLYLSRQIALDHGGNLHVEPGAEGVCFALSLPFGAPEEPDGPHSGR